MRVVVGAALVVLAAVGGVSAFQIPEESPLDRRVIPDPSLVLPQAAVDVQSLAKGSGARAGWDGFLAGKAGPWRVMLDGPAGPPLLVEGPPIPFSVRASMDTLPALERSLRAFASEHRDLFLADDAEMILDREATLPLSPDTFQVVFGHAVRGVPVRGDRYVFLMTGDNLVTFGTSRWTRVDSGTVPALDAAAALEALAAYAGATTLAEIEPLVEPKLELVPRAGAGKSSALVWTLVVSFAGERGTWVGLVDAHDGEVRGFFDDDRYAQVKGGVNPESGNGQCPNGCQQPNYPMPFASVNVNGSFLTANTMGLFTCQPIGATATTDLSSPTVSVSDQCGLVSQTATCTPGGDLDLGANTGSNCSVGAGSSAGNTRASRSCFYAVNRLKEHARAWWLTTNNWLTNNQTTVNTNVGSTCNATWGGNSLNMYREGGGCANTCVAVGVASHEWGHGMDQNDGGGFDNSSEAYGDISEILNDHTSCVGTGFFISGGHCSGYGDTCLTCTGIREMDWAARTSNTPATPAGFLTLRCPNGSGPCGKEVHCEAYVAGETIWDLAVRDLPASGLDQASAWQLADRLWYRSRPGSGGNMYSCALPNASGCGATTLFTRMRVADDDDGNLTNGTPHAAAIFAAFSRHGIACGQASDASNQSTTVCPALTAPTVSGDGAQGQAQVSWQPVSGATSYRVLRNDVSCDWSATIVASVAAPGTSYTDTGLANGFPLYYRVQAVGSNAACESPVSACAPVTPHISGPYAVSGAQQLVLDACASGGAGGDGIWDAGETVRLSFPVTNQGSETLTSLQATISTASPGVEFLDGTAAYPDIAPGASAGPLAPYFTFKLPADIACGTTIPFDVQITAAGGSWPGYFSQKVGSMVSASATPLNESFSSGIPASWTVVDGGAGGGPAATWTTANPGGRTLTPPLIDPVAMVDSNFAGGSNAQDEQLITPVMNVSGMASVTLQFDQYFRVLTDGFNERGDVDVRSSVTMGAWVNVLRMSGADAFGHRSVNISAQAAGAADVQVRFRYYLAANQWWWMVDNVRVDATGPPFCMTTVCTGPSAPKPVAGLRASRASADGSVLDVTWDTAGCTSLEHEILYGSLAGVSSYALDGSVCGLGSAGSTTWTGVPAGDLWFVVVGSDDAGTEGSWGTLPGGAPRKGGDASGQCGNVFRNNAGTCP